MNDFFKDVTGDINAPYRDAVLCVAATDLASVSRAIYISTAGTITVVMASGNSIQLIVTAGQVLPLQIRQVSSLGTAVVVALY
jgi:hypothetical protein